MQIQARASVWSLCFLGILLELGMLLHAGSIFLLIFVTYAPEGESEQSKEERNEGKKKKRKRKRNNRIVKTSKNGERWVKIE